MKIIIWMSGFESHVPSNENNECFSGLFYYTVMIIVTERNVKKGITLYGPW